MNFNDYDEEQEKLLSQAIKSAHEFSENANKLNPKYQAELVRILLGIKEFKNLLEFTRFQK